MVNTQWLCLLTFFTLIDKISEYKVKVKDGDKDLDETIKIDTKKETETFLIASNGDTSPDALGQVDVVYDFKFRVCRSEIEIWHIPFLLLLLHSLFPFLSSFLPFFFFFFFIFRRLFRMVYFYCSLSLWFRALNLLIDNAPLARVIIFLNGCCQVHMWLFSFCLLV